MARRYLLSIGDGMPCAGLQLPAAAHVPGTGTEPDWPQLDAAKAVAAKITTDETWAENPAFLFGFALMRAGYYWEAHEVWEPVWLACRPNSRERSLLRTLIQIANANLKLKMGRERAARRLFEDAQAELSEVRMPSSAQLMGVDVARLRSALKRCLAGWGQASGTVHKSEEETSS